jgi:hypothetical protein
MKRIFTISGFLLLMAAVALAQNTMDQQNEKNVKITSGPSITGITGTSANINWTTSSAGANHVRYRVAGSNSAWKSAYAAGGGTNHNLQLSGLEPGKTYEWQILTRDGDVRTAGQFQSAGTATGTAPDVNAGSTPAAPAPAGSGDAASAAKVPLYRGVNSQGNLHVYSTNASDESAGGFKPEGVAGYLLSSPVSGAVPLYRLSGANGDTLLTTDANEHSSMQARGYHDMGIVGYVESSQVAGTQPLYRMVRPDGSAHFYTTSATEHAQFISLGWKDEGIAGYIWAQQ